MQLRRLLTRRVAGGRLAASTGAVMRTPLRAVTSAPPPPPPCGSSTAPHTRKRAAPPDDAARSLATTEARAVASPAPSSSAPSTTASNASDQVGGAGPSAARRPGPGASSAASIGKSKHGPPRFDLKVKKKAPWGVQQLRDSWSEDAMTKGDRDNMDERIHREYRYHPDEFRRRYIRYATLLTLPCVLTGISLTYYWQTGRPIWTADPQFLLNLIRYLDTSPRSKLYAYRLEDTHELPDHVLEYRRAHAGQREYDERVFRLTNSAFQRPSEDELRMLELEEQLKAAAAAAAEAEAESEDGKGEGEKVRG